MNVGARFRINRLGWFIIFFSVCLIIYVKSGSGSESIGSNDGLVNIKSMLRASIYAAQLGGQKVLNGKQVGLKTESKGKTNEGANDPVTNADISSHCSMYYSLKKTFPSVNIISEEHTNSGAECEPTEILDTDVSPVGHRNIDYMADEYVKPEDVTIWIDPLDATQEYTEDLNEYVTTMVCVAIKGAPIVGVIHFPFDTRTVWGWYTKTHSTNLPTPHNNPPERKEPRVIVSRSHQGDVTQFVKNAFGENTKVTPAGGAGYKVYQVATNAADVYIHTTAIKKWDICAGNAIISSLNGKMTTLKGNPIHYSKDDKYVNSEGLLVTLFNHDYYLNKTLSII